MTPKIGIDIGNVLTERKEDGFKPFAGTNYLQVKPFEGSFEGVQALVSLFGAENVFLVSRCNTSNQPKTLAWLDLTDIFNKTGILKENIYFCLKRDEKRPIAEELGLHYFVDDRWSVLVHLIDLANIKALYLFNPFPEEKSLFETYRGNKVILVERWSQIITALKKGERLK